MKTTILFPILAFVAFFTNCSEKKEEQKKQPSPIKKETIKVVSEKEKWFNSLDSHARSFVQVIDSLDPTNFRLKADWREGSSYHIDKGSERTWMESPSETHSWSDNDYNEESGEITKKRTRTTHIGNSYLLCVQKDERWRNLHEQQEVVYETFTYILQYGVLLKPDTLGKNIFPMGTYVAIPFTSKDQLDKGKYEVKYFSNYEKLLAFILEEMESAKEFNSSYIAGYLAKDIVFRL